MAYNITANGLAKAFNKTIIKILKKHIKKNKWDWHEKLGGCLLVYRTTIHTLINAMLFSLVYGCDAVLPLEIQIPLLHTILALEMTTEDNHKLHLLKLKVLDEQRLQAQQHIELCQAKIAQAFNKKVKQWVFKPSNIVLTMYRPMIVTHLEESFNQSRRDHS